MNRSERRQLRGTLEQRVLAGERKVDIVGQAAVDGQDWQSMTREIALIPTPARRRRWRWLNLALIGLLLLAAAGEIAGVFFYDRGVWLIVDLVFPALFLVPIWGVVRFRARAYTIAASLAAVRLSWWVLSVAMHHTVSVPAVLLGAQITVCSAIIAVALLTQRMLLPETRTWTDMRPKTDAAGTPLFEE